MDVQALTYLGTLDDMVDKYPWRFRITEQSLNRSLAIQLIDGCPILLNDGYLVQHPLGRQALLNNESLLWELIRAGFIRVLARGAGRYDLAQMPERMARDAIPSYQRLVADRVVGVSWPDLREALEHADRSLRGKLVPWPGFDSGSGFRVLAERLRDRRANAHSLGLTGAVHSGVIAGFLDSFIDKMSRDTSKPRTVWEGLAGQFARKRGAARDPAAFKLSMMNLANEMYHYNMGVMLAAEHGMSVAVETQASAAFDDLLVLKNTVLAEPEVHRLNVPAALATVEPSQLVRILEPNTKIFETRERWISLRRRAESSSRPQTQLERKELKEAGREYATQLAKLLGPRTRYEEAEGLFGYVVGMAIRSDITPSLLAAAAVGAAAAGAGPIVAGAVSIATGYIVYRAQKALLGGVTKKFKIMLLKNQLVPPQLLERSARTIRRIKQRRSPSSIEISRDVARALASRMSRFEPREG